MKKEKDKQEALKQEIQPAFNLLHNPWIRVRTPEGIIEEVSMLDVFRNAHLYADLAGETQAQNFAVLRVLLAVSTRVLNTWNIDGEEETIEMQEDALDRWQDYWEEGSFPSDIFSEYLESYSDRFWLIHPEKPFWQSLEAEIGTEYKAGKLIGELAESSNKTRIFSNYGREGKETLDFPEATRWLIALNGYDDTSSKPKRKNAPSPGAGWLGQLGQVYAKGQNLFETLMLNTILMKDGTDCWPSVTPSWEREVSKGERIEILPPSDPGQLLTLISRRILLTPAGNQITGYKILGGDFFDKVNAFTEQYTLWRPASAQSKKKSDKNSKAGVDFTPRRHDSSRQIWRDFSNIIAPSYDNQDDKQPVHQPGIVSWVKKLSDSSALPDDYHVTFETASVQYGDKDFFATDLTGDTISIPKDLLTTVSDSYRERVIQEVEKCEKLAKAAGVLNRQLFMASGASGEGIQKSAAAAGRELAYEKLNLPFKSWIHSIDISEDMDAQKEEWAKVASIIARKIERELSADFPAEAIMGRMARAVEKQGGSGSAYIVSIPSATARYYGKVNELYPKDKEDSRNGTN